jgi:hypothetical protein
MIIVQLSAENQFYSPSLPSFPLFRGLPTPAEHSSHALEHRG